MAQYEIAGRADDLSYAQTELLCDYLSLNFPFFSIKKRAVHPDEWESELQEICSDLGLEHKDSHIVWTPEGRYVGTVTAFLLEIQRKYNINWRVPIEMLSGVATENMTSSSHQAQQKKKSDKDKIVSGIVQTREKNIFILEASFAVVKNESKILQSLKDASAKNAIVLRALNKASHPNRGVLRSTSKSTTAEFHSVKFKEGNVEEELTRPKTPQGNLVKFRYTIQHIAENLQTVDTRTLCEERANWSAEISKHLVETKDGDKTSATLGKYMSSLEFYSNLELLGRIIESKRTQLLGCATLDKGDIIKLVDEYAQYFAECDEMIDERFKDTQEHVSRISKALNDVDRFADTQHPAWAVMEALKQVGRA